MTEMKTTQTVSNPASSETQLPGGPGASLWFYWGAALVVLLLDWVSKWIVVSTMQPMQSIPVVGEYLKWTFLRNPGAAFSFLANSHSSWRFFLIGVAVVTMVILSILAYREKKADWSLLLGMGLVCGGAAGNLWDRVTVGTVVDFIEVGIGTHRFPVFNLADSAVCVGVGWLMFLNFKSQPDTAQRSEHAS